MSNFTFETLWTTLCLTVGSISLLVADWSVAGGTVELGTRGGSSASGGSGSFAPAFSADGQFIVFVSQASNLVTNDDHAWYLDVFVRDLLTGQTHLVSVNTNGVGGGDDNSNYPSISANGRYVAFASAASNLSANDTSAAADVFVRDITSGTTTLASVSLSGHSGFGLTPYNVPLCGRPQISADGRKVVFESGAADLVSNDINNLRDIFLRNLDSGTTTLISVGAQGNSLQSSPPVDRSHSPALTPDANRVAFVSTAINLIPNLVPAITNRAGEVYVRDVATATTFWASRNASNAFAGMNLNVASYGCFSPSISADGLCVVFKTTNSSAFLFPRGVAVVHHDLQTGQSVILATNSIATTRPSISADGRFVAYEVATLTATNLRVWDQQTGTSVLANVPGDSRSSFAPALTADGGKIAFVSSATNLVAEITQGAHQVYVRDLIAGITRLVSAETSGRAGADLQFVVPAISPNGQLVAFDSADVHLVAEDRNNASDVFVRNLDAETTQLVSPRHSTRASVTEASRSTLGRRNISGDGRWLAFSATDIPSVPGDTNTYEDVYVRDLVSGVTQPVSVTSDGSFSLVSPGRQPVLSDNSRFVAYIWTEQSGEMFPSRAALFRRDLETGENVMITPSPGGLPNTFSVSPIRYPINLSANGNRVAFQSNGPTVTDIYVRDLASPTNTLISINRFGTGGGNGHSVDPFVSPDGRWVLFASLATDLTTNATGGTLGLFVRDLASETTRLLAANGKGHVSIGLASRVSWSVNSRWVSFTTRTNTVLLCDLVNGITKELCASCDNASLDAKAGYAAYQALAIGAAPLSGNIVIKDLVNGPTNQITKDYFGPGSGTSVQPLLTPNSRYVVFTSKATNLVENDFNVRSDVFLYDRWQGSMTLVSRNAAGTGTGNEVSSVPQLSSDGRTVIFSSLASDLVDGDYNDQRDIFVLRLATGDSDADGLDDDWEVAFFGNLARNGTGDFDLDGSTDTQEFIAGTDPTNSNSILRVLTLERMGGGVLTLLWTSIPGRSYQLQYKDDLAAANWTNLGGPIQTTLSSMSANDTGWTMGSRRFYRVLLAP